MGKRVQSVALWLLILAALLGGVSWLFLPKDNSEKAGMVNELTTGYLTEPDNTLDVLVLGDSRTSTPGYFGRRGALPLMSVPPRDRRLWVRWRIWNSFAGTRSPGW